MVLQYLPNDLLLCVDDKLHIKYFLFKRNGLGRTKYHRMLSPMAFKDLLSDIKDITNYPKLECFKLSIREKLLFVYLLKNPQLQEM